LDLHQTELVVLSACQTQLGQLSAGDEVVGLTRAFMFAGAPTVVASLWSVDDAATALLMERFYGHLQTGLGKSAALRQAQLDLLQDAIYRDDPYYWAAFVLSGDGGQVSPIAALPTPQAETISSSPTPTPPPAASTQTLVGGGLFIAGGLLLGLASLLALGAMVWLRWRRFS
jgi:hypothetical protein